MAIQPTYPGVYVQEVPSGVRTIVGVSTSVTVFIGRAKWGPVNEPYHCLSYSDFENNFTSDAAQGDMVRAVRLFFLNGGTDCYIMRIATHTDAAPANNVNQASVTLVDGAAQDSIVIQARYPGELGNTIRAVVDYDSPAIANRFNLNLYRFVSDRFGNQKETDVQRWTGLSLDPLHPRFVEKYVDYKWATITLVQGASGIPVENTVGPPIIPSPLIHGSDGIRPAATDYDDAYLILDREVNIFNLMVLPKDIDQGLSMSSLWAGASIFCQKRRAFLLIDPPEAWNSINSATDTATGVDSLRVGLVKDHSAIFFPNVKINENGSDISVGPSGCIAGLMARIDANRGVWKAPAGTEADLRGVNGLMYRFSDSENGVLNPRGVNTIRSFPNGIVNWGARTMDGDDDFQSEYKYIPVRRFALFIEESLYRGLKWVVFEPNDEPLWSQIRLNVGAFMHNLFIQDAFQGQTPKDAYFVKCDKETTTQNDINLGIVNIWVGFAPLKPAEFVILHIQQMAGKINQ